LGILQKYLSDTDVIWLLGRIVESFDSGEPSKGLPLGNLTSQLLVNVYMNEFDQFVKHTLKVRYYVRYADDFVILHHDRTALTKALLEISAFLSDRLKLILHPDKTFPSLGVDFLGWVHFPDHRILRTTTKRRMFKRLEDNAIQPAVPQSYFGLLRHGNTEKLKIALTRYIP
jgi:hypothetical protein